MNIIRSFPIALVMLGLSNCGSSGKTVEVKKTSGYQQNHGPFDSNGNYVESWADDAPKRKFTWKKSSTKKATTKTSTTKKNTTKKSTAKKTTPKKTYTPAKKTTPRKTPKKPIARKITPKTKSPVIHTVKKGDTLYGLARKYGATVSAIQKANGIKGSNIGIGKRLTIPRK